MKTRTLAIGVVMLSLAAAALLAADAAEDLILLPSDGVEGLPGLELTPASAAAAEAWEEEKKGGDEDPAAATAEAGVVHEATRPWACCNTALCTKSFPPMCRCLDEVEECAGACQECKPSALNPLRKVCNDQYHGEPGLTCGQKDDDDEGMRPSEEEDAAAASEGQKAAGVDHEAARPWACCNTTRCTRSFPPTCSCLDEVDECAITCQECKPAGLNPFRKVCNDQYHGDPGPICGQKDDDDDHDVPAGASRSVVAAAAPLLSAFVALLFI